MNITGNITYIFKTEYNGIPVYLSSLDEEFNGELKVVQTKVRSDLEAIVDSF